MTAPTTSDQRARINEAQRKRYAESPACRAGYAARQRKWKENPKNRAKRAATVRKSRYGLTPEQYAEMLAAQGGLCAICRKRGGTRGLTVDHCHETGVVRGLLCDRCNTSIGGLGDTLTGLMRAVRYLRDARKRQQMPLEIEARQQ